MSADDDVAPSTPSTPPGSRAENGLMLVKLIGDLLSTPWHLAVFFCTRGGRKRRLLATLRDAAARSGAGR